MADESDKRRIVLVGAGHAHLYSIRHAATFTRRGFELVIVAPDDFWYSGLATGVLAGIYPALLDRVDIAAMLAGTGARLIRAPMSGLDRINRRVLLADGSSLGFGALSLNLGSAVPPIPGSNEKVFPAKPVTRLIALHDELEERFRGSPSTPVSIAIAGAGITGCEIAAGIAELARRHGAPVDITIYSGKAILSDLDEAAAEKLIGFLRKWGIQFRTGARVVSVKDLQLHLAGGSVAHFDFLVNATGLEPPLLTRSIGLSLSDDGGLVVDDRLMAAGAEGIFAAGDCIAFRGRSLPRVGVYAIRQAPILFHNLMAFVDGKPLKGFVPQERFLSIMTLGDGQGFAQRSGFWWLGHMAFLLKDWIDRRFLRDQQPEGSQSDGQTALDMDGIRSNRGMSPERPPSSSSRQSGENHT